MTDLSQFETRYWNEIAEAMKGDRTALVTKLRTGVQPTPFDLLRFADLLDHKNPKHRPRRAAIDRMRKLITVDDWDVAADRYDRIMDWLRRRKRHYRMQAKVDAHVCRKHNIETVAQFSTWRRNRRSS